MTRNARLLLALILVVMALIAALVAPLLKGPSRGTSAAEILAAAPQNSTTRAILGLPQTSPAPHYDRSAFGDGWMDTDRNGCDTRNDILARDLERIARDANGCTVLSGTLADPYTGERIVFARGTDTSGQVQIDHVVALSNAWQSGAWQWNAAKRIEFANDPDNLLAVGGEANQEKGALAADQWLPPRSEFRCEFVRRQVATKAKWALSVTEEERSSLAKVIVACESK